MMGPSEEEMSEFLPRHPPTHTEKVATCQLGRGAPQRPDPAELDLGLQPRKESCMSVQPPGQGVRRAAQAG